nr:immunoglobulin heavy chain junction region [Macaca mulatta]
CARPRLPGTRALDYW